MTQAIAAPVTDPMTAFREKVLEKLRADIGAMMPDEALAGMVKEAVEGEFFKRRKSTDGYGRVVEDKPSWFVEEVAKLGQPIIKDHVTAWLAENKPVLEQAIKDFLADQNLMLLAMAALQQASHQQLAELASHIISMSKRGF